MKRSNMDASGLRARLLNLAVATAGICVLSAGTSAQYLQYPPEQKSRCVHAESFLNRQQAFNTVASFEGPQPFDVQHYKLDLDLPMTTDELRGRCVMTLLLKASVDSLVLNAVGLSLDSVRVDAIPVDVTLDTARETFTLHLQQIRNQGEVLTIELAYHRIREYIRRGSRYGYYYFSVDSVVGLPANLGYTMSEPSDARFWMPCFDEPWDKATAEVNITVPAAYTAASNGRLLEITENGDGTRTWHWRENHQIAPYLLCVTVSAFSVSRLPYVTAGGDTIPIEYYVWDLGIFRDSSAAASYLPTVRSMVGAYSGIFGEYPFDKYGMTAIVPFKYGGMEHQTITTLNRHLFTYERLVAHELAHQWWGDLVTCGTWPDVWLNESFATYSEALWQESKGGKAALRDYMKDSLEHFNFLSWTGAVYDPVSQGFNLLDDVVYSKGAWVLHSLRGVIGDSAFFHTLRTYRSMYEQKNATTEEFLAVLDTVTNVRMRWFFDQWVYGRGWPQYALRFGWRQDTLSLTIYQQQDVSCPTYLMPLHVRAYHGTDSTTFVVWDSLRTQHFSIPLSTAPDKVVLDPDDWVLKQIVDAPNGVDGDKLPETFVLDQNYPNPFNPLTHIGYRIPLSGWVSLKVFDLLGREVATLTDEKSGPGEYTVPFDGQNLPSGVYVYQLRIGNRTISRKMVLMK